MSLSLLADRKSKFFHISFQLSTEPTKWFSMAEILSVVAGVVGISGFAGQIATGAIKLRSLYSRVKNADKEFEILADDISLFATVLEELESHAARSPIPVTSSLTQCQRFCGTLITKLDSLIRDLEVDLKNRNLSAKIKFAFKKDAKELKDALSRAHQSLMLAICSFSE